jgi:hypothetical protein
MNAPTDAQKLIAEMDGALHTMLDENEAIRRHSISTTNRLFCLARSPFAGQDVNANCKMNCKMRWVIFAK